MAEPDEWIFREALGRHLREEVIGRFNCVLYYSPLSEATYKSIWAALVRDLEDRIGTGTHIQFDTTAQRVLEARFAKGKSGARGIRDFFVDHVIPLVADARPGDTVPISAMGDGLIRAAR